MDERGNYVRIDPEEVEAIAAFVRQRSGVSPAEMNAEINRIIKL